MVPAWQFWFVCFCWLLTGICWLDAARANRRLTRRVIQLTRWNERHIPESKWLPWLTIRRGKE